MATYINGGEEIIEEPIEIVEPVIDLEDGNNGNGVVEAGSFQELEDRKNELMVEYPTPDSAVEYYRSGVLTDEMLELRFTPEEIDYIRAECERINSENQP
ncbi:MAG: hypothetical protein WCT07_02315 [Candidatus Paceibacterota bacterium]|jgi:hypothetical protein